MDRTGYKQQVVLVIGTSLLLLGIFGIYTYAKHHGGVNTSTDTSVNTSDTLPYLHGDNSFNFRYPKDMTFTPAAEEVDKETHETVLFASADPKRNFQIFIAPYSGPDLTMADIQSSNTDLITSDSKTIQVGGAEAFSFLSASKETKFTTWEVWLVREGKIYQISTYPEFKEEMKKILAEWRWLEL